MCGENACHTVHSPMRAGSPPRVRGKRTGVEHYAFNAGITPACAGKTHGKNPRAVRIRDHPRVCGENLSCADNATSEKGSPPRVRGKLRERVKRVFDDRITPACAGKTRCPRSVVKPPWDHPRVCGENGAPERRKGCGTGSPPRVRGKPSSYSASSPLQRITPACAGKTPDSCGLQRPDEDHPRVCGENEQRKGDCPR